MTFFSNVFNDPSSPWYYVIGVLFLVLIFGALAAYIVLSKRKNDRKDGEGNISDKDDAKSAIKKREPIDSDYD